MSDRELLPIVRRKAISGLVGRLSPEVAEIVRQDLIQSVGNALRMQQREGQAALQSLASVLGQVRDQAVETESLDEFIQKEVMGKADEWGAW